MASNLLVTFGCSWTFGIGAAWVPTMDIKEYHLIRKEPVMCQTYAFRTLLCKHLGWKNRNFSMGASSNQKQFRLVKEYFTSPDYEQDSKKFDEIIILHGITSTARNELYNVDTEVYENIMYTGHPERKWNDKAAKFLFMDTYDHHNEIKQLEMQMRFFNMFYKSIGVKNYWFDTFNHHSYKNKIDNFLGFDLPNRDLLSQLAIKNGLEIEKDTYHFSNWKDDCVRTTYLQKCGILNTFSNHPTKKGHEQIAEILLPYLG